MADFDAHKDYYSLLQVGSDASIREINSAYRKRAREIHPDYGGSEEQMKLLNEAYAILGDVQIRRAYDLERVNSMSTSISIGSSNGTHHRTSGSKSFDAAQTGSDIFGLMSGAILCLGLGVPFLILVELEWMFFLWPLRILSTGIILLGLLLAHAAFRQRYRNLMQRRRTFPSGRLIGEFIFWVVVYASVHTIYLLLHEISK